MNKCIGWAEGRSTHGIALLVMSTAAILGLGFTPVAEAQQQCRVEYGWISGGNNRSSTVNIAMGQTQMVSQSNMRYVRNRGDWPVAVNMTGVMVTQFTLQKGDRNPNSGNYQTLPNQSPPNLLNLGCPTPNFGSTTQLIDAFKNAGQPLHIIAGALKDMMGRNEQQVASALRSAQYDINLVANALRQAFNGNGQQLAQWLRQSGFTPQQIGPALREAFNASANQVAEWLNAAGANRTDIAHALTSVPQFNAQQVISALRTTTNASAEQVVQTLKQINRYITTQNCGVAGCPQPGQWLRIAGYTADETLRALRIHFNLARDAAEQMASSVFGLAGNAIQEALQYAGYAREEVRESVAVQTRPLNAAERRIVSAVFGNTINFNQVRITNTIGANERPWVSNSPPMWYVNVGQNYNNLHTSLKHLLVHEMTHVWQGQHGVPYMSNSALHQGLYGQAAYDFTPGRPWWEYNIEQQAGIVEAWYTDGMKTDRTDKLYPYIRDHIRQGRPYR